MDGKKVAIIGVASAALLTGGFFLYRFLRDTASAAKFKDDSKKDDSKDSKPTIIERIVTVTTGGASDRPTSKADIKAFQKWVIDVKKDKTILGSGGDSGFGDDGVWGSKSQKAWDKYGAEYKNKDKASGSGAGSSAGSGANPNWSSTDNGALNELADRIEDRGWDVDWQWFQAFRWDTAGGTVYPTVYVTFQQGGSMWIEKDKSRFMEPYGKVSGTWKKTSTGWEYNIGGKTYKSQYSGEDFANQLWKILKDLNFYSWSTGKWVEFLDGESSKTSPDILDSAM
jgi:hypothetical protein